MFQLVVRKESSWYRWEDGIGSDESFAREVFDDALGRPMKAGELGPLLDRIAQAGRREAALEMFAQPERLLTLAKKHGL
jgi:hypothetical protein